MMNRWFFFASDIEMYSDQYEVEFGACENQKNIVQKKVYVGNYFDSNGDLDLVNLKVVVLDMINEYKKKFI